MTYQAEWEAIVNTETVYTDEYYARVSAEENASMTDGMVEYTEEWYAMVVRTRQEILER